MVRYPSKNFFNYIDLSIVNLTPLTDRYLIHEGEIFNITFFICNLSKDSRIVFSNPWLKVQSGKYADLIGNSNLNTFLFDKSILAPKGPPGTVMVFLKAKCYIGTPFFSWGAESGKDDPIISTRFVADLKGETYVTLISPEHKLIRCVDFL